jgi:hypothetical protein
VPFRIIPFFLIPTQAGSARWLRALHHMSKAKGLQKYLQKKANTPWRQEKAHSTSGSSFTSQPDPITKNSFH